MEEDLTRAAESLEQAKEGAHGLLHAPIGVEVEARLFRPNIADGHGQTQFAASCLGPCSFDQSTSQHRQLEFAHRALEAEQQAIVGLTRVVNALGVDHAGADQAAQLEQVMPVTTVACQTGRFETEDTADRAFTQLSDQGLKPGPLGVAARRATEVVVEDGDVAKPIRSCQVGEVVLLSLALQVVKHLGARRLPHVHDRAPTEHARRQLRALHRRPRVARPLAPARRREGVRRGRRSDEPARAHPGVRAGRGASPLEEHLASLFSRSTSLPPSGASERSERRPSSVWRRSTRAARQARREPRVMPTHASASSIQAGMIRFAPCEVVQMATCSPFRCSR